MGKAIGNHRMIEDGDRILVAVSGGKDSLALLYFLRKIQSWSPVKFSLMAVHVEKDFSCGGCTHEKVLKAFFKEMEIPYVFKKIQLKQDGNSINCFWCSWNRRRVLFETANELGFNKIALGHHKDDIIETVLMNLIYRGNISAINPRQEFFGGKFTMIRPLCYVEEETIREFAREKNLTQGLCRCPYGEQSRRKAIKNFIQDAQAHAAPNNIRSNILRGVSRIKKEYVDV